MKDEHFIKLEQMYLGGKATINDFYEGIDLKVFDGRTEMSLQVDPKYFHAASSLHGSVYFKLLDDAAFFAVNSVVRDVFVLTSTFQVNLLRPVTGGTLFSYGKVESATRNYFVGTAELRDERGRRVALGRGQFVKSKLPLSADLGYVLPG